MYADYELPNQMQIYGCFLEQWKERYFVENASDIDESEIEEKVENLLVIIIQIQTFTHYSNELVIY